MSDRRTPVTLRCAQLPEMDGRTYRLDATPRIGEAFVDGNVRLRVRDVVHQAYGNVELVVEQDTDI